MAGDLLAIVLAAGGSSRMGRCKALLELDGEPLVAAHVAALGARCDRVVVVVGAEAEGVAAAAAVEVVPNPAWASTHPADSLGLALRQLGHRGPCLVTPVDTPPASPATLDALLAAGPDAVPVTAAGHPGHPVLIGPATVAALHHAAPDGGLRTLLADARRVVVADPLAHIDFDTPSRWRTFLQALAARRPG